MKYVQSEWTLACVNAGGRCCSPQALEAVWHACIEVDHRVEFVFMPECDFVKGEREVDEFEEFIVHRSWPGEGSRAMAWLYR